MSIQSTVTIKRPLALKRIERICELVQEKNYIGVESETHEHECGLQKFVDYGIKFDTSTVRMWTNDMLAKKMDQPFYRLSMFDNYIVEN